MNTNNENFNLYTPTKKGKRETGKERDRERQGKRETGKERERKGKI